MYIGAHKFVVMAHFIIMNDRVKRSFFCSVLNLYKFKYLSTCKNFSEKKTEQCKLLKPAHEPKTVEADKYEIWESRNYFKPSKSETDLFVVLLPPPNVTGTLHLGHALTCTIQDVILRWKRMKGESVLWVPGIDHAGIATQVAVEKHLGNSLGLSRHDLGKEKFQKIVWEWKNEKSAKILEQLKKMGASLDWSKLIFTMDPAHSKLVTNSFIQLHNDGMIYRKESLVNWCCALKSSISDIEVDWISIEKSTKLNVPGYDKPITFGYLYEFAYKVCDEDEEIVVSTTRPETILGDVAVAIHPDYPFLSKFKNKYVWHPFRNEKIPIIVDDFVDPDFGTGAVKVTPSHSPADFELSLKHNLKCIDVINESGLINKIGSNEQLHGLKRFDARWAVIKILKDLNLFRGTKSHSLQLPVCSRSGDIIEFLSKKQWFLKCDSLVKKAVDAVRKGTLKIEPEYFKNVWYNWLENKPTRDWNLSRQLWWGHQIPMYECQYKGETVWLPSPSLDEAKTKASKRFGAPAGDIRVVQDPDVLDTWFSSGLLSLNVEMSQKRKPPISLLVTGHDILFFWVARMVMLSIQLTGELPFKQVLLHSLVCDADGKKMSKSLGNVIHPDDVISGLSAAEMENRLKNSLQEGQISSDNFKKVLASQRVKFPKGIPECGADALRFTLCSGYIQSHFVNFDVEVCLSNKFFCNKIYQGMNYYLKVINEYKKKRSAFDLEDIKSEKENLNCLDKFILSKLGSLVESVNENLTSFQFKIAADSIRIHRHGKPCSFSEFGVNKNKRYFLRFERMEIFDFTHQNFTVSFPRLNLNNAIAFPDTKKCINESTKPVLKKGSPLQYKTTISVLFHCMETSLRLLSPFMPFITDYLYEALPSLKGFHKCDSITIAKYPTSADWDEFRDSNLESRFNKISELLTTLRRAKSWFNLNKERPNVLVKCSDELAELLFGEMNFVFSEMGEVRDLIRVESLERSNVIQQEVDKDIVAFIEHKYDKATLQNLLGPVINKEKELNRNLNNLQKITETAEWENMIPRIKYSHSKRINNVNLELKKIKDFKFAIENCAS